MIKNALFILIAGLIFAGAWYGQSEFKKITSRGVAGRGVGEMSTSTQKVASSTVGVADKNNVDLLQKEALSIVARPIIVTENLPNQSIVYAKNKIAEAIASIKNNYDYDASWFDLASYRRMVGDYDGALQAYNFLRKIRPKSFVVLHNLGEFYMTVKHDYAKAEDNLLKSIAFNPASIQGYLALKELYAIKDFGRLGSQETILLKGLVANADNSLLAVTLASYYRDNGNVQNALKYFEVAHKADPNNAAISRELQELQSK